MTIRTRLTGDFFEEWNEITPQTHIKNLKDKQLENGCFGGDHF